jgi:hypothetical protein
VGQRIRHLRPVALTADNKPSGLGAAMNATHYFTEFRGATGGWLDFAMLAVLLIGAALGVALFIERPRHDPARHSPRMAWLRASIYFCFVILLGWLTGVLQNIVAQPLPSASQLASPGWVALTGLCLALVVWGYVIWWPRGTLTHGRPRHLLPSALFGLVWGACGALVLLSLYAIIEGFGWPAWATALLSLSIIAVYNMNYQSGWWDIHVSPPHNIRAWNSRKVLFAHNPFLLATLAHLVLFGNAGLFMLLYALAMACSAVAMRFPPFWAPDGPPVSYDTAIGE